MAGSTQKVNGTFKSTASTPYFIAIPNAVKKFQIWNLTYSGQTALGVSGSLTSTKIVEGLFLPDYMSAGTGIIKEQGTVSGILAPLSNGVMAINGFTYFNAANQTNGSNVTGASFVPGQPTVFTATAHGFLVGDIVRIFNVTSAPQLGGLAMTVTAVTANTFTTLLDSTNALTSVFTVYKIGSSFTPNRGLYYPENRTIAKISLANPMVVTTLVQQNYQIGDVVRFQIPTVYGMQQINSGTNGLPLQFTVSAVNNAVGTQTVTFANTDSTAFTALASLTASSFPTSFPIMVPQGEGNTNNLIGITPSPLPYANQDILGFAKQNQGVNGIIVGAGDGTNSATTGGIIDTSSQAFYWEATTVEQTFTV